MENFLKLVAVIFALYLVVLIVILLPYAILVELGLVVGTGC